MNLLHGNLFLPHPKLRPAPFVLGPAVKIPRTSACHTRTLRVQVPKYEIYMVLCRRVPPPTLNPKP